MADLLEEVEEMFSDLNGNSETALYPDFSNANSKKPNLESLDDDPEMFGVNLIEDNNEAIYI